MHDRVDLQKCNDNERNLRASIWQRLTNKQTIGKKKTHTRARSYGKTTQDYALQRIHTNKVIYIEAMYRSDMSN